jgi:xylose isomerase
MQEKVQRFNDNKDIQDLLKEIHGANPDQRGLTAKFGKDQAKRLKEMSFDVGALASRRLPYERLDQLVTELLLGVL